MIQWEMKNWNRTLTGQQQRYLPLSSDRINKYECLTGQEIFKKQGKATDEKWKEQFKVLESLHLNNPETQPYQLQARSTEDIFPKDQLNQHATKRLKKILKLSKKLIRKISSIRLVTPKKMYDFWKNKTMWSLGISISNGTTTLKMQLSSVSKRGNWSF